MYVLMVLSSQKGTNIYNIYVAIILQSTITITMQLVFKYLIIYYICKLTWFVSVKNHHSFKDITILSISHFMICSIDSYNNDNLIHIVIWKPDDMN